MSAQTRRMTTSLGAHNQRLGRAGERLAACFLQGLGYEVVETNWRCELGELDLVAVDDDCFVFVEVKTRSNTRFGGSQAAVGREKLHKLRRLTARWMQEHDASARQIRIDVVAVQWGRAVSTITHLRGV